MLPNRTATPPLLSKYLILLPPLGLASFLLSPPVVPLFLQLESEGEKRIEIEGKERGGRREREGRRQEAGETT